MACETAARWARDELGWEVGFHPSWRETHPWGGAGSGEVRAAALCEALEGSDAVMCSGGGDHAAELLDHLGPGRLAGARGAFVGTSDNSMLAVVLAGRGVQAWCGPDLAMTPDGVELGSRGGGGATRWPVAGLGHPLDHASTRLELAGLFGAAGRVRVPYGDQLVPRALVPGDAEGPLVAVNLQCLLKLAGTRWWPAELLQGAVLVVEESWSSPGTVVAQLVALDQLGVGRQVSALVLGWMVGLEGPQRLGDDGIAAVEAAATSLGERWRVPVWRSGVFGHRCAHALLPVGAHSELRDGELWVQRPGR